MKQGIHDTNTKENKGNIKPIQSTFFFLLPRKL